MTGEANQAADTPKHRIVGRYALFDEIASGGMATVHVGRLVGPVGFSRTVAIKKLHPQFAKDPEFVSMFLDEARLASRIQHPNVVSTLDIVTLQGEIFLIMEYVHGESLSKLIRNAVAQQERIPPGHVISIMAGILHGLHAAHEAKSEKREPLNIVHRDISPQNILVGADGVARVLDFGVAKAALRAQSTRDGQMKGKLSYMSPEQLNGLPVDRRTDVFAAGVVLWEALCGRRLFQGADAGEIFAKVLTADMPQPKSVVEDLSEELNWTVMRALERDPNKRFQTAREFAIELEDTMPLSTPRAVGEWVEKVGGDDVLKRAQLVSDVESVATEIPEPADRESSRPSGEARAADFTPAESSVSGSRLRPSGPEATTIASQPPPAAATSVPPDPILSNAPPPLSMPPQRGMSPLVLAAIACIAGGALAFLVFARSHAKPALHDDNTAAAQLPAATPPVQTPHAEPATVNIDDLPTIPPDAGAKAQPKPAMASRPRATAAKTATKPAPNCNPPWTLDKNGIRRLKPECL